MNDEQDKTDEPKIIVDEDWKSQVQAEKEAAQNLADEAAAKKAADPEPPTADDSADGSPAAETAPENDADAAPDVEAPQYDLPEPSLELLINTMAAQAMVGLGILPDPVENKPVVRLELAKHQIDMLGVIEEKTAGNRTAEESENLASALQQLRIMYVSAVSDAAK